MLSSHVEHINAHLQEKHLPKSSASEKHDLPSSSLKFIEDLLVHSMHFLPFLFQALINMFYKVENH